ncbi:unnamed protein product [Amoebophrya sp. A25]|nr:unnamed protein product [Amoebophrya sp. A25]|eukprot:GSA25T00014908001.1
MMPKTQSACLPLDSGHLKDLRKSKSGANLQQRVPEEEEELRDVPIASASVPEQEVDEIIVDEEGPTSWICGVPFLLFILWLSSIGEVYFPDLMNDSNINYWNFKYKVDVNGGKPMTFPFEISSSLDSGEESGEYLKKTLMLQWLNTCANEADCRISVVTNEAYLSSPHQKKASTKICDNVMPAKGERLDIVLAASADAIEPSTTAIVRRPPLNPLVHYQNMGRLVEQQAASKSAIDECVAKMEYVMRENPDKEISSWMTQKLVARPMHLFSFLIHRLGNVMVLFFKPAEAKVLHQQNWVLAAGPAICEGLAQICLFTGIVLSCAQLKTIIYCSGSVWSAIGAWLFLEKKLNQWQIVGMALVILGLVSKSKSSFDTIASEGSGDLFAIMLMLTGTILHSLTNVFNQKILTACATDEMKPIPPASLAVMIGIISCVLYGFYFFGWVYPEWEDIVLMPVNSDKWTLAWIGIIGLLISSWLHAASFFFLLGNIGVVSCGMVKGAQTGSYVVLSHMLWCDYDSNPKQCIDTFTGIATGLSIGGVLVYSYASVYCGPGKPATPETDVEAQEDPVGDLKVPLSVVQNSEGRSITLYSRADRQKTSSVYSISMNHVVDETEMPTRGSSILARPSSTASMMKLAGRGTAAGGPTYRNTSAMMEMEKMRAEGQK